MTVIPNSTPTNAAPAAVSRGLRVAFVVHDYHRYGGHSRYVAELATRFRADHEVHVFTNTVDDPVYLQAPWVTAIHFKKEPDGAKWDPSPCDARF